jgi:dolichol-phosphate mannosyltransferase
MNDLEKTTRFERASSSRVSVVAPVCDERELVGEFVGRVRSALEGIEYELILVDDGSTDGTSEIIEGIAAGDPRVRVITLSRNFGHQAALTAGLDRAAGDPVVMLDADLQDPPELIPAMLERWRDGFDVVYAVRRRRDGESRFKRTTAGLFYRLFDRLASVRLHHNSGDFRLLDRAALRALQSMRERSRFLRGMTVWVGYRQTAVHYDRDPRHAGRSKYTPRKMVRFSLDALSSFSHVPLQLATWLGFAISGFAFLCIPVVIVLRLLDSYLPGFGTITIAILLLGGIELIAIGIIGEYLGRIYDEVKARPLYVVRDPDGAPRTIPVVEGSDQAVAQAAPLEQNPDSI